jgi:hypothetical protein
VGDNVPVRPALPASRYTVVPDRSPGKAIYLELTRAPSNGSPLGKGQFHHSEEDAQVDWSLRVTAYLMPLISIQRREQPA